VVADRSTVPAVFGAVKSKHICPRDDGSVRHRWFA
jgi:hypothetical protein